ncbi:MAG: DUF4062 domain-containing protein [Planctomycetes bacterium]|nr:DUF4062 domain-containing protein [Planctomycetota bacterium]
MNDGRKVLRVFLSSTAMDMAACREKVRDTVLQLEQLPVGMETFTALPTTPAADCQAKAAEADVVIVMVAHRYGYAPGINLGGDGKRSITWLEVLSAQKAGRTVYTFLIDPKAAWNQPKEVDRLNTEPKEKEDEILTAVRGLKEFKAYLQANCTFDTFTNEDDLARKVATTLSNHVRRMDPGAARHAKMWRPRVCYPLQPAPFFQGRQRLRAELLEWARAPVTADRVVSLVAVGGTGKTALAERVLADLGQQSAVGVLVWSFYENPRTEEFLRTACEYFTGEAPSSAGGLLERLQIALTGDESHLLVLDGLERVQAEGTTGRPRGELEDPQLRRLLHWLAAGQGTRARALVTSRFPLVDLNDWRNAGYREERLEDLEPVAACGVLHGWGVKGDDTTLDALAAPLHYHALSVAVLGSYLGKLWGGDPTKAPTFDRNDTAADDPKAAKLGRILGEYANTLSEVERDLLARLAAFPRGVKVALLSFVAEAGALVAGAIAGSGESQLLQLLERLRSLGLVFGYQDRREMTYTAHPFLRDFFKRLLAVPAVDIHEAVRSRLAPSLDDQPARWSAEPGLLDSYEVLIEHTRLAGRTGQAFDLYWHALGGYRHLGNVGESVRGLRIVTAFAENGVVENAAPDLPDSERALLAADWGLYAEDLGDLVTARQAFAVAQAICSQFNDPEDRSIVFQNLAMVEMQAGRLLAAREAAERSVREAATARELGQRTNAHAYLGAVLAVIGDVERARRNFAAATRLKGKTLYGLIGVWEAEFQLACGDAAGALRQTRANWEVARRNRQGLTQALCDAQLGQMLHTVDPTAARRHLEAARDFGARSGEVEVQLRCHRLGATLARHLSDLPTARAEAEAGLVLADGCGFVLHAVDLRLALARAHLDAGDPRAALQRGREALDRSVHPECQYAWGEADGLHLCGVAHARLGEVELARQRLTAALAKREQLTHPGLPETGAELARLGG